jgi:hypothetical protein
MKSERVASFRMSKRRRREAVTQETLGFSRFMGKERARDEGISTWHIRDVCCYPWRQHWGGEQGAAPSALSDMFTLVIPGGDRTRAESGGEPQEILSHASYSSRNEFAVNRCGHGRRGGRLHQTGGHVLCDDDLEQARRVSCDCPLARERVDAENKIACPLAPHTQDAPHFLGGTDERAHLRSLKADS